MAGITGKSVLKSCMDRDEREVGVNSVGESRMDKTGSGWKKVKGIGNVVSNTRKLHWISESKMMNTRNSYYNKRKKMDKLDGNRGGRQIGREPRMDKRGKWQEVACSEVECWRAGN